MSEIRSGTPVPAPQSRPSHGQVVFDAERLRVSFPTAHGDRLVAVDDISLSVRAGNMLGVVGESGSGKTTVARCLVGLQAPDSGTITLCGSVVRGRRTPEQRRAIQLVFQDPYASLNPRLRIGTVLRELLATHRLARGEAAEARCRELMALVGLPPDALASYPSGFSGGQRQRIAIARALAVEPSVLVADEPISALDVSVQATILALFADLRDRLGIGVVMISHNLAAVRHVCDQVAVMYLGKVVEQGTRDAVFGDPRHPYTIALLAAAPRVRPGSTRVVARLVGEPPSPTARPSGCSFHPRCPRAESRCAEESPELLAVSPASPHVAACHFREERRTGSEPVSPP
jgi:oligopeptide/dipeptide ABC transporter ATP-binding protein